MTNTPHKNTPIRDSKRGCGGIFAEESKGEAKGDSRVDLQRQAHKTNGRAQPSAYISAVRISGKYIIPKSALVDFIVSDAAFEIVNKSSWHMNTILWFAEE